MLLGLAVIPALLAGLGPERFGVLALLWTVATYFGLFDFGLSRAISQGVAKALAQGAAGRARGLASSGEKILGTTGVVLGLALFAMAPAVLASWKEVPDPTAAVTALRVLALGLPAFLLTSSCRGVLEGAQAFLALNLLRLPLGAWNFLGPGFALWIWGPDLVAMAWALVLGRGVLAGAFVVAVRLQLGRGDAERIAHRDLLVASGWLTVAAVANPLVAVVDRLLIGAVASAGAVTQYVTPLELVTKLALLPASLASALLPQWVAGAAGHGPVAAWDAFKQALRPLLLLLLPPLLLLGLAAEPMLRLWLGVAFDPAFVPVLQCMCVGMLLNGLAYLPSTWLQARGEFRALAVVQGLLLVPYVLLLWALCAEFGVIGASVAWAIRMGADAAWLWVLALQASARTAPSLPQP